MPSCAEIKEVLVAGWCFCLFLHVPGHLITPVEDVLNAVNNDAAKVGASVNFWVFLVCTSRPMTAHMLS